MGAVRRGATAVLGELQARIGVEPTLHSKLEPDSEEEKVKVGVGSLVRPDGPEPTVVSGGVMSAEKVVKDRVRPCPAGTVMGQLRPAPLSWRAPQSHVSGKSLPSMPSQTEP